MQRIDLTGKTFGRWHVDSEVEERSPGGTIKWNCTCKCGNTLKVSGRDLKGGKTQSCGCFRSEATIARRFIDLTGKKFNRLYVNGRAEERGSFNEIMWECTCDCGNSLKVRGNDLRDSHTQSCGCFQREQVVIFSTTHGCGSCKSPNRLYRTYAGMKRRCYNINTKGYSNYGGRGINVCSRWLGENGFINFMEDMGEPPGAEDSINRIDNNGNYEPSNCEWASRDEQANNTRRNVYITYKNETKTVSQWARVLNMKVATLRLRLRKWSIEKSFTAPLRESSRWHVNKSIDNQA